VSNAHLQVFVKNAILATISSHLDVSLNVHLDGMLKKVSVSLVQRTVLNANQKLPVIPASQGSPYTKTNVQDLVQLATSLKMVNASHAQTTVILAQLLIIALDVQKVMFN
jgi:hypothetical protein